MEREDAYADGQNETKRQMMELIKKMMEEGLSDRLSRLAEDEDFVEELLLKYKLKE